MAATPCSGIPLSARDLVTTYDSAVDYIMTVDSSQPFGQKTKRILYKDIFSGWTIGDMLLQNNTNSAKIIMKVKNSSGVLKELFSANPNQEVINFAGITANYIDLSSSSDNFNVKGNTIIRAITTGGDITLGGFSNGTPNQPIILYKNTSANNLIIKHNSVTGDQPIITPNGVDITLTTYGGMLFVCSTSATTWFVINF